MPPGAAARRTGRRHPLYLAVRAALLAASLAGLWFGAKHAAVVVEEFRHAGPVVVPEDETVFRATLVGALAEAVLTFDFDGGIRAALAEEDYQKAETLHAVAATAGVTLSPEVEAAYREAMSTGAVLRREAWDFVMGAVTGASDGLAGIAGALGADLLIPLYGDMRDAGVQLWRYAQGEEVAEVLLGLAAVGLTLVWMQPATDPLKVALRFKRLGAPLSGELRRLVAGAVDLPGLKAWLRRGGYATEPTALAGFVRRQGVAELGRVGGDLGEIWLKGGRRATVAALRTAEHADDLALYRRVATTFGEQAETYLTVLGRRTRGLFRTSRLTAPLLAKALALGSLLSAAGALLLAALSQSAAIRMAKTLGLRWLARALTPPEGRAG